VNSLVPAHSTLVDGKRSLVPDAAAKAGPCEMVLQAVGGDMQLLLSLPFTPSTCHVALARAIGARHGAKNNRPLSMSLRFMMFLPGSATNTLIEPINFNMVDFIFASVIDLLL
jgi:hypothetical protein